MTFVILLGPFALIVFGNLGAGLVSSVIDIRPTESEVLGSYTYSADWGQALLSLQSDHSFVEQLTDKKGSSERINGRWSSSGRDNALEVIFDSFLSVQDEDHGQKYKISEFPSYKQRFGSVYVLINDDVGEQFTKVK